MDFRSLAIAAIVINLGFVIPASAAQDAVYNTPAATSGVQPIFIPKPQAEPSNIYNINPDTAPAPQKSGPMTEAEYKRMVAENEAKNERVSQALKGAADVKYNTKLQEIAAQNAADKQARLNAENQKNAQNATAVQAGQNPNVPPVTYVFPAKKKDEADKPVRLFNVR